jgi:hypothetical protein
MDRECGQGQALLALRRGCEAGESSREKWRKLTILPEKRA